ncbi:uncharacterized protein B0I36DRAFT_329791 [Microdochium trichocladiopsis]|uniref:Uncharacterized protein n=1 Tax=Microdochium trichocladiopsis TaxID=1682393 RepID=A0A9P8Y102_9PEZI|nr:uncharacterized protein B0I36DRAFT_329791 [Microdochium trichocladiopsis]KAH7026056.1 hypothetical protein B0I36DRAFT_329791 [Microdochium trichocladiopsis]
MVLHVPNRIVHGRDNSGRPGERPRERALCRMLSGPLEGKRRLSAGGAPRVGVSGCSQTCTSSGRGGDGKTRKNQPIVDKTLNLCMCVRDKSRKTWTPYAAHPAELACRAPLRELQTGNARIFRNSRSCLSSSLRRNPISVAIEDRDDIQTCSTPGRSEQAGRAAEGWRGVLSSSWGVWMSAISKMQAESNVTEALRIAGHGQPAPAAGQPCCLCRGRA